MLFALGAGEVVVAKTALLGALFANALLILGLAILVGSWREPDGVMRFGKRLPNDTATLLLLASSSSSCSASPNRSAVGAGEHAEEISVIGAVLLLGVYVVWVWSYLRAGKREHKAPARFDGIADVGRGRAHLRRRVGGHVRLRVARPRDRPSRRRPRHLAGIRRARHRRDRRERGRERGRDHARRGRATTISPSRS